MKISYDEEVDALYIRLLTGKYECRTITLNENVSLNIGEHEQLVGIEILDAKKLIGNQDIPSIELEHLNLKKAV